MNPEEREFFNRQIKIKGLGLAGQEKIKGTSILIVGLGGLGCQVFINLLSSGVGKLFLVDGDIVSRSNLSRQWIYTEKEVGRRKVEVAKEFGKGRNPWTEIQTYPSYLNTSLAKEVIPNVDLVIDCSDNFNSRYLINDSCVFFNKPFIYGGMDKDLFQWAILNWNQGPTYRCLFPEEPKNDFIKACNERGILSVNPSILGSIQARESIRVILEDEKGPNGRLNTLNLENWDFNAIELVRTEDYSDLRIKEDYGGVCSLLSTLEIGMEELDPSRAIIDVREEWESAENPINGAINIPLSELPVKGKELDKDKAYALYCDSGRRSLIGIKALEELGFENVQSLRI